MSAFAELQQRLGHAFRDENLLYLALTHPSVAHDANAPQPHNQRLEFLGDSVLGLTLAQALYEKFPDADEGVLTKSRAKLVNAAALADHARTLNLGAHLILSRGEENTGGRDRASSLEDAFEAVVGAIYLDSDFATVRRIVLGWYGPLAALLSSIEHTENPKGRLQELVQPRHGNDALRYEVTRIEGAPHERKFEVQVFLHESLLGTGSGKSK